MSLNICGCNENINCGCDGLTPTERAELTRFKSISNQNLKITVWNKSGFFGRLMLLLTDNQPRKIDGR